MLSSVRSPNYVNAAADGIPVISVDTKKKELVGLFKNPGVAWNHEPVEVNDHDFRSEAKGIAIPYGIYDLQAKSRLRGNRNIARNGPIRGGRHRQLVAR